MKTETMELLTQAARSLGMGSDDWETRTDYSGRGMYGETTCAVVVRGWSELAAMAVIAASALPREEVDDFAREIRTLSTDHMGRDSIVIY